MARLVKCVAEVPKQALRVEETYRLDTVNGGYFNQLSFVNTKTEVETYMLVPVFKKALRAKQIIFVD